MVQEGQRWDKDERFHYAGYPGIYPRKRGVTPVEKSAGTDPEGPLSSQFAA